MTNSNADEQVLQQINRLAAEEHGLFQRESSGEATDADRARMQQLKVTLDQCWDLLRQRRARREFGQDPDEAQPRDSGTVERYQQ